MIKEVLNSEFWIQAMINSKKQIEVINCERNTIEKHVQID